MKLPRQPRNLRLTKKKKNKLLALNFETEPIELSQIYVYTLKLV